MRPPMWTTNAFASNRTFGNASRAAATCPERTSASASSSPSSAAISGEQALKKASVRVCSGIRDGLDLNSYSRSQHASVAVGVAIAEDLDEVPERPNAE